MTTRRRFIQQSAAATVASSTVIGAGALASEKKSPLGKAEHVIMVWLGGGACHIDTWDPKRQGDAATRKPGSYYSSIKTAIPGTKVCEHLPQCADLLDRFNIVRTVNHSGFPDHAAASNFVHTGRATSGTIVYPSIGSLVTHGKGPLNDQVPAYILIGYPNVSRGPGFLGAKSGFVYLTDTESGPPTFTREAMSNARQTRRERLLAALKSESQAKKNAALRNYDVAIDEALRLSGPGFQKVFNLDGEQDSLRESYGSEFGQRCLLARRLLQSGVRFVEVSHNLNFRNGSGWDTHRQGQLKQHLLIKDLDDALATLVTDLERTKLLDKTLVVVATEFGRPAGFDNGGGRDHHFKSYSMVLAGGGLKNGMTIGQTDDLGMKIVDRPVSIPDFHATIAAAVGINPSEELYAGDRPVPLTDHGTAIHELFG